MLFRKFQFYLGIVNTFLAVFYMFLGIFSAFMHKISHLAMHSGRENAKKNVENSWKSDDNSSEKFSLA